MATLTYWDDLLKMEKKKKKTHMSWNGGKGYGKSISNDINVHETIASLDTLYLNQTPTIRGSKVTSTLNVTLTPVQQSGYTRGWQQSGDQYTWETNPYDRYTPSTTAGGTRIPLTPITLPPFTFPSQLPEKPKYTEEELKGKLVAYATITTYLGQKYTGILFVRKCGAWKLIECKSMSKVAGGGKDSILPEVTIHYLIYTETDETKSKRKKSRFDDIE